MTETKQPRKNMEERGNSFEISIVALKYELDVLKEKFGRFAFLNLDGDVELVRLLELFYLHGWTYLEIREYMYGNKKCESYARTQISNFMKSLE